MQNTTYEYSPPQLSMLATPLLSGALYCLMPNPRDMYKLYSTHAYSICTGKIHAQTCLIFVTAIVTKRGLNNSSYPTRTEFNNCFIIYLYIYRTYRVNACIVNKNTQATKPFVFSCFWHRHHKLV